MGRVPSRLMGSRTEDFDTRLQISFFCQIRFFRFFFLTFQISYSAEEIMASEQANATSNLTAVEDVAPRVDDAAEKPAVDANANAEPAGTSGNKANVNNNGLSLSDVASAVASAAKSKSSSSKKSKKEI